MTRTAPAFRLLTVAATLAATLAASPLTLAQLPGTTLQEAAVNADIAKLFSLAGKLYPGLFQGGSSWYSYGGYTYKYFPAGGIYAGVKDGNVFLMGGPYGNEPKMQGNLSALNTALQNSYTAASDFSNILPVKTTADIPRYFKELTVDATTSTGALSVTSKMVVVRVGTEQTAGVATEHLQVTITASNTASASVADMWVDDSGTTRRFILNGFEYATAQANLLGASLVSGILLNMAAPDTPTIKVAIQNALKNPAVSLNTAPKSIAGGSYQNVTLKIGDDTVGYTVELTDFGSFSMATSFESKLFTTVTSYQFSNIKLR